VTPGFVACVFFLLAAGLDYGPFYNRIVWASFQGSDSPTAATTPFSFRVHANADSFSRLALLQTKLFLSLPLGDLVTLSAVAEIEGKYVPYSAAGRFLESRGPLF